MVFELLERNMKNVVGFLPAGFTFCAYFRMVRHLKRPLLAAVIAGVVVSLTIELIQGLLPTRDSGTTDLITNAIGSVLGAFSFQYASTYLPAKIRYGVLDESVQI